MNAGIGFAGGVADLLGGHAGHDELRVVAAHDSAERLDRRHQDSGIGRGERHGAALAATDEVGDLAIGQHLAAADDDELIGEHCHLLQEVARHEHRTTFAGQVLEQIAEPRDALRIQSIARLVEDQRMGVAEQCGGDAEALAHTEAELPGLAAGDGLEPDHAENLVDPGQRDAVGRGEHPQVIARGSGRVEWLGLEERPDMAHRLAQLAERPAVERRRSLTTIESEHEPHRGRLARAVGPEEAGHATRVNDEREVDDGRFGPIGLAQVAGFDDSHGPYPPMPVKASGRLRPQSGTGR